MTGCGNVNGQDVDKWLIMDDSEFNTNDDDIVFNLRFMTSTIHHL